MLIVLQTQLTTLDLGANFITTIENIAHLTKLEELWVKYFRETASSISSYFCASCFQINGNKIPDLSALDTELKSITTLKTLYLEMNPCQENDRAGYRRKVMLALPHLIQIDALYVHLPFLLNEYSLMVMAYEGIRGAQRTCQGYISNLLFYKTL